MNKFERLKKMQSEFHKVAANFISSDPLHFLDSVELEFTLNVVHLKTGKLGFVQLYDENTVEFIVTSEGSKSYLFSKEEFENEFYELPRNAVNELFKSDTNSPKFISKENKIFLYLEETSELASDSLEIISLENEVKWMSKSFGIV